MWKGTIREPETNTSEKQSVYWMYDVVPTEFVVSSQVVHQQWTFLASIHAFENKTLQSYTEGQFRIEAMCLN